MAEQNKVFVGGLYLDTVHEKAPEWVITNQTIHVEKFMQWLQENKHLANEKGYIRITGKEGKEKKRYFEVNTYVPEKKDVMEGVEDINPEDIPF